MNEKALSNVDAGDAVLALPTLSCLPILFAYERFSPDWVLAKSDCGLLGIDTAAEVLPWFISDMYRLIFRREL